jgi:hypothetical protein
LGITRRSVLSTVAAFSLLSSPLIRTFARAQGVDPLPSWNNGAAKQAILAFVHDTTDASSSKFVPEEARIATFDQDGTLWVEHPMYTQVMYCMDRVPVLMKQKPQLRERQPFKTILSGDREAIAKLSLHELEEVLLATLTGMTIDQFNAEAKAWIETAKHPRWDKLYTDLTYQPMQEVLRYLRANGYRTYIVTGGGLDEKSAITGTTGRARHSHEEFVQLETS